MRAKEFFHLDIKKLFEEHNIREIEEIQKTVQHESDRKKMELRTLVGERYRDLIEAADTIAEMRQTSEAVISRIAGIETTFRDLQQKYLIGFKTDASDLTRKIESRDVSDSVVMQIKILTDIPEHVWSAIDDGDLLLAARLFILARRVNYGLTFQVGRSILTDEYPVVAEQWNVVGHFRNVILDGCDRALRSPDLSTEVAANCLAALVLLDGATSKDLLEKLINPRCRAIESIIKDESPRSVRHRIKLSVKLLTDTVVLVHSCFTNTKNGSRGLVADYVTKLTNQRATEMLRGLDLDNEMLEKFLPDVTKNHRPFENDEFAAVADEDLRNILDNWLDWVEKLTTREIARLLSLVTSIRGIYNIREESLALESPENWDKIIDELSLPKKNFWSTYYQPLLTKRVKAIIEEKWREALDSLKKNLVAVLSKISDEKYECSENDLTWYVWKDSNNDIPEKLGKIGNIDGKSILSMKSRGYSANIMELCYNFDDKLRLMLADLEEYLYENHHHYHNNRQRTTNKHFLSIGIIAVFDKFIDRTEIQENLQHLSSKMMDQLVEYINDEFIDQRTKIGHYETNMIFLARFYRAMVTICPSFNKCFTLAKISGCVTTNVKFQTVRDRARHESLRIWSLWSNLYATRLRKNREKFFDRGTNDNRLVGSFINEWEKVVIEEEAEEGKRIKSQIFVPYRASVDLVKFLSAVTSDLNKLIPHTLPKKVIREIVDRLAAELLDHYDAMAKNSSVGQKRALQILFDIKYVTLLTVPCENKSLVERSTQVGNNILAKIDPFDSDVFYPFIHANVKKCVQRSLLIYGNLVPRIEQLHSVLGSRGDYASNDGSQSMTDPPGGLAICTDAPWFPPLAVTAPTRNLPLMPVSIPDKAQIGVCSSGKRRR